ncbi:peptidoglycan-binding domain-containing protein [Streptomyces sp. NPDC049602]|uniref:peptidoglycan-binding domain-containing protein n=1 Tax=Streptomyces sp. NPDC049602 TaxID=3155504 RepID=UPI00341FA311
MRPSVLTRAIVSATAVVGLAAGTLATAGTSFAAAPPAAPQAVGAEAFGTLATNNFGLSNTQAKYVQGWLAEFWDYNDNIDGLLGTNSWKAYQRCLARYWGYTGSIDGDPGTNTIKALQRQLKATSGYTGAIDGIAGPATQDAFKRFANAHA